MRLCPKLQKEEVKPFKTPEVQCDDCLRTASTRQPSSERRLSQLEDENRNLRLRLAGSSSSGPSGHNMQQARQDIAQSTQADSSSMFSSLPSSSATTPPSWSGDSLAEEAKRHRSTRSRLHGLTSASVLEDTLGNFGDDQDNPSPFSASSFSADSALLSQRLETEAAKQRTSSP